MRRILLLLLLLALPLSALVEEAAEAEPAVVIRIADESELPEGWAEKERLRVTVLETGRSDAILVECGGEAMLVDGGDASWSKALRSDLEKRGLTEFKYFLNTHPHNDHVEGLTWLMEQGWKPERFMSPFTSDWNSSYHQAAVKAAWNNGIIFRLIRHGDVYELGGAQVHIYRTTEYTGMNDRSAIGLITFGERRILLAADLTGNAQKSLLKMVDAGALQAEIVKAPHHGENAMVAEFLTAVNPSLAVCTAYPGEAPDLARQLSGRGLPLLYSGEGEVVMETDGVTWYVWQNAAQGRER